MSQSRSKFLRGVQLAALAALGATALAVTPAWATGITWTYTVSSTFDTANTTFSGGCGKTHPASNSVTTSEIIWGCESPRHQSGDKRSKLDISGSPATGTVVTDGADAALGVILTHHNFVINGSHLKTTNLINQITLTGDGSDTDPTPFDLTFGINFIETDNSGHCTVAPDPGFGKCPDIFVLDNDSLDHSFTYGENTYFLSIFPAAGIDGLSAAACHKAGSSAPCSGFVTQEKSDNDMEFSLAITSKPIGGGPGIPVPEPNVLGMMGFGLFSILGLLFLRRRRTAEGKAD